MTADVGRKGIALVLVAATLWALNANLSRALLEEGISPFLLAELRSVGACACFLVVALVSNRTMLRCRPSALPLFALIGIPGFAFVYAFNYIAIERVEIGVAQSLAYLCPLFLLVLARVTAGTPIGAAWYAFLLGLSGTFLVAGGLGASELDVIGIGAGIASAVCYAVWIAGAERAGREYRPLTVLVWSFAFAALFWLTVRPVWTIPFDELLSVKIVALMIAAILGGTVLPFLAMLAALKHVPGGRAAIVAMVEPALAALLAFGLFSESLSISQVIGCALVLAGAAVIYIRRGEVVGDRGEPVLSDEPPRPPS